MLGDGHHEIPGFARRILSLSPAEIGELLSFLFIKMQYRIGETAQEESLLYLDLIEPNPAHPEHTLACWTGDRKTLDLPFLQNFLKNAPIRPADGSPFARGFILSPYDFSPEFQSAAGNYGITLFDGQRLADLLIQHEFTYYLPEITAEEKPIPWKKILPFIFIPVLLIYGFFAYQTFSKHSKSHGGGLSGPLSTTTEEQPAKQNEVSLLTPSNAAPMEKSNEIYKRLELQEKLTVHEAKSVPAPEPAHSPPPALNRPIPKPVETPKPQQAPKLTPPAPSHKPSTPPAPKPHLAPPPQSASHTRFAIFHKYQDVVDLEEKYYLIARDLDKHGQHSQAKIYYKRYLKVAPGGAHAAEARAAINK